MMNSPNGTISSNVALNRRKLRKLLFTHYEVFIFKRFRGRSLQVVPRRNRFAHRATEEREWLFGETIEGIGTYWSLDVERGLSGKVVNILYYIGVLLMCVHYCGDDVPLDRFLQGLRKVLIRYAEKNNPQI